MKILSNSLYGVLGNVGFRFYDIDNATSTTLSGQAILFYCQDIVNKFLDDFESQLS
jgi:DNA polymerase elongation subunit (family B)